MLIAQNIGCVRQHRTLFQEIHFSLSSGELLLISGPNGSGKTSLLRLIAGLIQPDLGDIFWENANIFTEIQRYWSNLHWLGHQHGIKLGLTVQENLSLVQALAEVEAQDAEMLLSQLKLDKYRHTQAGLLSEGQKRRLALLRVFSIPKKIWILDEPIASLDEDSQVLFNEKLSTHLDRSGICILSSHQPIQLKPTYNLRMSSCSVSASPQGDAIQGYPC